CLFDSPPEHDFAGRPRATPHTDGPATVIPVPMPRANPRANDPKTPVGLVPRTDKAAPLSETPEWRSVRLELSGMLADFHAWVVEDKWVATVGLGPDKIALSQDSALRWLSFVQRSILIQPGANLIPPAENQRGAYVLRVEQPLFYLTMEVG